MVERQWGKDCKILRRKGQYDLSLIEKKATHEEGDSKKLRARAIRSLKIWMKSKEKVSELKG